MTLHDDYKRRCAAPSDIADHLPRLFEETCRYPNVKVIELGVRSGNSTAAFLAAAEKVDGHVWSVDTVPPHTPPEWHQTGLWSLLLGDDLDLAPDLPDNVNVVLIDTTHAYAHTIAELAAYVPKVAPGGVVLLHDTELERPELAPVTDPPFPVRTAIEDSGLVCEWVPGCYGLGVIRISEEE